VGKAENGGNLAFSLGDTSGVYHAFIVGTNGTGKTTFLNNIILGIGEKYPPHEVELYLADLKQGVEFQFFADHPNCRAIILGDNRKDDMLNLLQEFADKIEERGELFKAVGVRDLDEYNDAHPETRIPRLLLIVDEAQKLFAGSWKQAAGFSDLLELVARQGRGFGIHIILSTQTLTNANINPAIMSQIPLRIAFKLIASEVFRIFPTNNDAPAKLAKYQFIYNAEAGVPEANRMARAFPPREIKNALADVRNKCPASDRLTPTIITGKAPTLDDKIIPPSPKAASLEWNSSTLDEL